MVILGIETSCDETAAAIVKNGTKIISNVVASSQELHIKTHGVIPEVAAREQLKCIIPVIKETINKIPNSKFQIPNKKPKEFINAIAVTVGPGLIGSLLVGVETAKTLAYVWQKPIVPVNHLIGHIYTNFIYQTKNLGLRTKNNYADIFPAIVLIVSGGHTELLLMTNHGKYKWLGGTRDDAAGECFDKCARILGLGYPGGPAIEKVAKSPALPAGSQKLKAKSEIILPRPMIDRDNFDFSFSGLKTAVLYKIKQFNNLTMKQFVPYLAFEIQESITDVLVAKTIKAAEKFKVKSIILGGGVAANQRLREKFKEEIKKESASWRIKIEFLVPPPELCTDNAVGIASAAYYNFKPVPWQKITTDPGLEIA